MSMYALLRSRKEPPSVEDIEENLSGNLCRCTGYRPILDAFRVFAKTDDLAYRNEALNGDLKDHVSDKNLDGRKICPSTGKPCDCSENGEVRSQCDEKTSISKADSELIFPPELMSTSPK